MNVGCTTNLPLLINSSNGQKLINLSPQKINESQFSFGGCSAQESSTPIIELTVITIAEEPLNSLPESYIRDIFSAYGLSVSGLKQEEKLQFLTDISNTKKTFPYLREAIQSDRHPHTIMLLSSKIGMYIPPRKRVGLLAYGFYLLNVKYYEAVLERPLETVKIPSFYDIFMAKDRITFLMGYRDNEILQPGYRFSRNYDNRRDMIKNFILNNVLIYGEFSLENNSRTSYATKARVIVYSDSQVILSYNTAELLRLFDLSRGVLWKDFQGFSTPSEKLAFNRLSLLHFRQQILEKFVQWRHRDSNYQVSGSVELYRILFNLESILVNEVRNDTSAYLGNPQLNL